MILSTSHTGTPYWPWFSKIALVRTHAHFLPGIESIWTRVRNSPRPPLICHMGLCHCEIWCTDIIPYIIAFILDSRCRSFLVVKMTRWVHQPVNMGNQWCLHKITARCDGEPYPVAFSLFVWSIKQNHFNIVEPNQLNYLFHLVAGLLERWKVQYLEVSFQYSIVSWFISYPGARVLAQVPVKYS